VYSKQRVTSDETLNHSPKFICNTTWFCEQWILQTGFKFHVISLFS